MVNVTTAGQSPILTSSTPELCLHADYMRITQFLLCMHQEKQTLSQN